jgi:hypothetical protein
MDIKRILLAVLGTSCLLSGASLWMLADEVVPACLLVVAALATFSVRTPLNAERISEA